MDWNVLYKCSTSDIFLGAPTWTARLQSELGCLPRTHLDGEAAVDPGDVDAVGLAVSDGAGGQLVHVGTGAQLVAQLQSPCGAWRGSLLSGPTAPIF